MNEGHNILFQFNQCHERHSKLLKNKEINEGYLGRHEILKKQSWKIGILLEVNCFNKQYFVQLELFLNFDHGLL